MVMPSGLIESSYPSGGIDATFSIFGGFVAQYSPPVTFISHGAGMSVAVFGIGTGPFASGFAVFPATTAIGSIALAATAISLFMFILVFLSGLVRAYGFSNSDTFSYFS